MWVFFRRTMKGNSSRNSTRKHYQAPRSGKKDSEGEPVDFKDFGAQILIEVPATAR